MQTRTLNAIVLAVVVALGAAGLVAVADRRKKPDLGGRALDAVPSGAMLVGTADLAALRASPVGATLMREGREIPGLGKVKDVCGFDPLDTLSEAAIAIPSAGDAGEFGLVAAGPIDDEALLVCAAKVIEARGGRPVVTTIGSFRSVRDAALPTAGGEIAVKKGGPLLLGAGTYLRSMIDAADGRAPTIRSSRAHAALAREVAGAAVRITVVLSQEQRRTLLEELVADGATGSPAAAVAGGALGVSFGPSVAVHGVISCDDAASCGRLAVTLEDARKEKAREPLLRLVGVGAVLEQLALHAEGELVHARVDVPADQATQLAERLLALRNLRRGAPDGEPSARPAAPPPDEVVRPAGSTAPSAMSSASAKASAAPSTSASAPPKKR